MNDPLKSLVRAAILAGIVTGQSAVAETTDFVTFKEPPSLGDIEAALGLPITTPRILSRAIQSVDTGARLDAPGTTAIQPKPAAQPIVQEQVHQAEAATAIVSTHPIGPTPRTWVTEQIGFANNSDAVFSSALGIIDSMVSLVVAHPNVQLVVSGHANATGSASLNQDLSKRRAETVRRHIVYLSRVHPDRVLVRWAGAAEPLPGTAPTDPRNRRVQFGVLRR